MSMIDISKDEIELMTYTQLVREIEWQEYYKTNDGCDGRYVDVYNKNIELLKQEVYKLDN